MSSASMPLTAEQRIAMRSDSAWLKMTPEQEDFIRSTQPGQVCCFYDDNILRVTEEQMSRAMETAFKAAASSAAKDLGLTGHVADFEIHCDPPELGQMFLRVTVTDDRGRKASAIGMIPDPRGGH